jgi:alcohol dehydrogenase class IV
MIAPTFSYLNDVYFAEGVLEETAALVSRYGITRPFVVTDRYLSSQDIPKRAGFSGVPEFIDVETNPTEAVAREAHAFFRDEKCDGVVAIGGGSPIDLGKIVALMTGHAGPLSQYAINEGGPVSIDGVVPPVLAVPTTAGSGSEVGRASLMTVEDGRKLGFLSPRLLPLAAVCEPLVTASMPAVLTAACGMDAISHCVEAVASSRPNPVAAAIANDGLARGVAHIARAIESGDDLVARGEMMMCAVEGGLAFQKGLGAVHSLSHPLGDSKPTSITACLTGCFCRLSLLTTRATPKSPTKRSGRLSVATTCPLSSRAFWMKSGCRLDCPIWV